MLSRLGIRVSVVVDLPVLFGPISRRALMNSGGWLTLTREMEWGSLFGTIVGSRRRFSPKLSPVLLPPRLIRMLGFLTFCCTQVRV
ncbi:unnamed protein product [Linum tenue]|uniref:Uncharacterized protein n=1 Tax=Linum tenue TaxID=586396 RepID=A0AAV0MH07_9ROSI|nr:unnamed protein product [Linum tenue]